MGDRHTFSWEKKLKTEVKVTLHVYMKLGQGTQLQHRVTNIPEKVMFLVKRDVRLFWTYVSLYSMRTPRTERRVRSWLPRNSKAFWWLCSSGCSYNFRRAAA